MPQTRINTRFLRHSNLLEFNRSRRLGSQIIHDPVNSLHLIDNPVHHPGKHFKGNLRRFRGHEIRSNHRSQRHGIIVGALVSHDTHGAHVGEGRKILSQTLVSAGFCQLLAVDGVRVLHDADLVRSHLAHDAHAQTGAGEGLTVYQIFRQAQLQAGAADLILEQQA